MNWTWKLLAVALAAVAFLSPDVHAQSTLPKGSKPSLESVGVCYLHHAFIESSGAGEPYADSDAYDVYSAIIPSVAPNQRTHSWFIRADTLPLRHGSSLEEGGRREWEKARGGDLALDDWVNVNSKHWLLQEHFTLPKPYRLLTLDEIKATFPPNSIGHFEELWIELSAVGFNADKTMAVVYMVHVCTTSCCCAEGNSFVLQKQNGKWKVSSSFRCWIS